MPRGKYRLVAFSPGKMVEKVWPVRDVLARDAGRRSRGQRTGGSRDPPDRPPLFLPEVLWCGDDPDIDLEIFRRLPLEHAVCRPEKLCLHAG